VAVIEVRGLVKRYDGLTDQREHRGFLAVHRAMFALV
jgi:hypothetical protein